MFQAAPTLRLMPFGNLRPEGRSNSLIARQCRRCGVAGCNDLTKEKKPYCPRHVKENPYVKEILKGIQTLEKEEKTKKVIKGSLLESEFLTILKQRSEPTTIEKLAQLSAYTIEKTTAYMNSAKKRGLVILSKNRRGSIQITLVSK